MVTSFPYHLNAPDLPTLGLIVLQADETIEQEFRRYFDPVQVKLHVTRVPSGETLTVETIKKMEGALSTAAALLPRGACFDAVGYACTSGTTMIGAERVQSLVQSGVRTPAVTDPLSATLAATKALGLRRIGIVSPYIASVATPLCRVFESHGLIVPDTVSFGEEVEANVARIDPSCIADAARQLAENTQIDGIFLSCTNLRTLDLIGPLEAELDLPIVTSNLALAWQLGQLARAEITCPHPGRLLSR